MRTWCSDISPGWSTTSTARASSTSTMISCPRESRLPGAKVSRCATCSVWVPEIMRSAPLVIELSEKATHAVTTSGSVESWCQDTKSGPPRSPSTASSRAR